MSHEILSFQIGQCGNSIGQQFWQMMSREHGLRPDGQMLTDDDFLQGVDNKNTFFQEYETGRFVPRCIMLDLEPRVIHSIKNSSHSKMFEPRNMFIGTEGGGAGNIWANGYNLACLHEEILCDLIRRETEATYNLEGFLVSHAISGGTGAGMGSFILELLNEFYPKKILQTYSVFPTSVNLHNTKYNHSHADIVLEPYNSMLTLERLACLADSVIIMDNLALHNLTPECRFPTHPSFENINKIVAKVMTTSLAPVRYSGQMFNRLRDVVQSLTPDPLLHFLMTSYTPLRSDDCQAPTQHIAKTSVESVLKKLGRLRNMMVSLHQPLSDPHGFISVFNVIQGRDPSAGPRLVLQIGARFKQRTRYLPWAPGVYHTCFCPQSPYVTALDQVSGLAIANHSAIVSFFISALNQFSKLYKCKAYVNQMETLSGFGDLEHEMERCQISCVDLVSQYKAALSPHYHEALPTRLARPSVQRNVQNY